MSVIDLRPSFSSPVEWTPDEAYGRLEWLLRCEPCCVRGHSVRNHMLLTLADRKRHFWSPWLQLEVRAEVGQKQTIVHGRFSPHPSIWMGFALIYLGLGTGAMFATIFAVSQWMIGRPPNALWALPLCLGLAASLWLATRIGQGLAAKDMADLRQAVEESLQRPTFDPEP